MTSTAERSGAAASWASDVTNSNYQIFADKEMIRTDLSNLGATYANNYSKYVTWTAPNGKDINIVANSAITDEQLLRAWNILDNYLTDVPGAKYGADKLAVANAMANNGAVLVMPDGADGNSQTGENALLGQPLYQLEFPVEGSAAYINNDYSQRDAGFEEIFHMVHDYGIGTTNTDGPLKPTYQADITAATNNALANNLWGNGDSDTQNWISELRAEGSLEQEYIASVIDSHYGLWGAWTGGAGGMWGIYSSQTRDEIQNKDPMGAQLMKDFLSPDLTYMARIDPNFTGTFKMAFDASAAYTHKSQYLTNARLLGNNDSGLSGNARDNVLMGNAGANAIDGKGGRDVVQYQGVSSDYKIVTANGVTTVTSKTNAGDTDTLTNIETLRFMDKDIKLAAGPTAGNDSLTGTSGPDDVDLQGGNDSYLGLGGNDVLRGGSGNDTLKGNMGEDRLFGGKGQDKLFGGNGSDTLHGGQGRDRLDGGGGRDTLHGNGGNDTLKGGRGNDILHGEQGNDTLFGGTHADRLFGGKGSDTLDGGQGRDRLDGGGGRDTLHGNGGNDTLKGGQGNDTLDGGNGRDRLDGGDGNDLLRDNGQTGASGRDLFSGGAGDDRLRIGGGDDIATGGAGADSFEFFGSSIGADHVTDFTSGTDRLGNSITLDGVTDTATLADDLFIF